jgi:dsRNA-specific ribonuclease
MKRFHLELENPDLLARALRCTDFKASHDIRSLSFVGDSVFRLYAAAVGQEKGYHVCIKALTRQMPDHQS